MVLAYVNSMILYVSLKSTTDYRRPVLLYLSTREPETESHEILFVSTEKKHNRLTFC